MNEDRTQKENLWDQKVTTMAELDKAQRMVDEMGTRLGRLWITVIFLCGMCVGIGLIAMLLKLGLS